MAISKQESARIKAMSTDQLENAKIAVTNALWQKRPGTKAYQNSREYLTALQKESLSRAEAK